MPRPRTVSDEAIKEVARAVFLEHGPGAPVSLVAKRLGVSHAALFGRSGSKERLMLDALGPERPRALAWLSEPPPAAAVAERLVEILADLMGFLRRIVPNLVVLKAAGRRIDELSRASGPPMPRPWPRRSRAPARS